MKSKITCTIVTMLCTTLAVAQDSTQVHRVLNYDPDRNKIIPDKVFEFGVPLLLIYLLLNTIVLIFKIRAEGRLKEKAMDKGISESTLIELFKADKSVEKHVYLKWFLLLAALGGAFIYIYGLSLAGIVSPYMALGAIALMLSIAFLVYYLIIRRKK